MLGLRPDLLSVTLSPRDDVSASLIQRPYQRFLMTRLIAARGVVVGVWFGPYRRHDAEMILASARSA